MIQSFDISNCNLQRASRRLIPVENFDVGRSDCNQSPVIPQLLRLSLISDASLLLPRKRSQNSKLATADSVGNKPFASGAIQLVHCLKSSSPEKLISPRWPLSRPLMIEMRVLLPEPLWPSIRMSSPGPRVKLRSLNSGFLPKPNVKFLTSSIA